MRWRWARTPASPHRPHTQQLITRGTVGMDWAGRQTRSSYGCANACGRTAGNRAAASRTRTILSTTQAIAPLARPGRGSALSGSVRNREDDEPGPERLSLVERRCHSLPPCSRRRELPGEWRPCLGSAKPIACDARRATRHAAANRTIGAEDDGAKRGSDASPFGWMDLRSAVPRRRVRARGPPPRLSAPHAAERCGAALDDEWLGRLELDPSWWGHMKPS